MATGREIVSFFDDDDDDDEGDIDADDGVQKKKHQKRIANPPTKFGGDKPKSDPCEFCDKYKNGGQLHPVAFFFD